ncbi:Uncharacterized protein APZ42_016580 [Daphnia magna]|uniref:Uncharacterized protein n=1 Tax=Daphnia magna TaxID=35525 RepID=A0A0P5BIW0_9CRUS|nr:Uncharacterized protein APZ42_016580 [Daphnia magna]
MLTAHHNLSSIPESETAKRTMKVTHTHALVTSKDIIGWRGSFRWEGISPGEERQSWTAAAAPAAAGLAVVVVLVKVSV